MTEDEIQNSRKTYGAVGLAKAEERKERKRKEFKESEEFQESVSATERRMTPSS
jgi:hypothetical protein